jgi:hypothetical protein
MDTEEIEKRKLQILIDIYELMIEYRMSSNSSLRFDPTGKKEKTLTELSKISDMDSHIPSTNTKM